MSAQIKTLIIGGGSIGERHVRCFQTTQLAEVWLCDINQEIREHVSQKYQLNKSFSNLEEAIDAQPDIAVICTPAHWHISMAIQLAKAGIHLLIEKPVSTCLEGIELLQEIRDAHHLIVGIAYIYRSHPVLADMQAAISEGKFGKPLQLNVVSGQHFPYYRPAYRDIYYKDHQTGGGAVQDALTHLINAGEWLVGPVTQLVADAEHLVLPGVHVEDSVNVLARHHNILACYTLNQHQTPNESNITVICEQATVRFNARNNCWNWHNQPESEWQIGTKQNLQRDTLFVNQAEAFLKAVTDKRPLLCSLEAGTQTLKVNLAILESIKNNHWVMIDTP